MPGTRIAVLALAVGLALAGCGEDEDAANEFREGYNAAVERLNQVNSNIQESGEGLASRPGGEIAREFDRIAQTADRTRANLAELEPPEDAQEEFDRLLEAIQGGVDDIRAVADAARQENPERFQEATVELSESGQEISQAENELKDAVEGD
jgi:hypothetical protein